MKELTRNEQIAIGGGLALLIASFLPWYGVPGFSINAWDSQFWAYGGVLFGVAAAVVVALAAFGGFRLSIGRWGSGELAMLLAGTGFILVVIRLLTESDNLKFGLFVGLAATATIAFGAFQWWRAGGTSLTAPTGFGTAIPAPPVPGSRPEFGQPPPAPASPFGQPATAPPPATPAPAAVEPAPGPAPTPPAPVIPPKPATPPPQPAFTGYWFYVLEPTQLISSSGYPVAQLNPGAWYWASAEKDGWLEANTNEGASGWVATSAVHRQE